MTWDFSPPETSILSDHDVYTRSDLLKGKKIALIVCGGIAAMKSPLLARELRRHQASVTVYTSEEALNYTTLTSLEWSSDQPVVSKLSANAEHLNSGNIFDCYLIAPATYNTINKMALGIADSIVTTTLATALGYMERGKTEVIIAPTMHGVMHNSILTKNMQYLHDLGVSFIKPRQEFGKNNLPNIKSIVAQCIRSLQGKSLKGKRILVTAGNTPVSIDSIRRISTIFKGRLGLEIANELYFRGAAVDFILSGSDIPIPEYINTFRVNSFLSYKETCLELSKKNNYHLSIFSAAVADYEPTEVFNGKIKSEGTLKQINLSTTEKIIDTYQKLFKETQLISFKYEENLSHDELLKIAYNRLERGYEAVIANRGEEKDKDGMQIAHLVTTSKPIKTAAGKNNIAKMICDFIEAI
jgi:phosphopantothenoylcysteine decarboxylase / phosphopantothenate---cysteine ligase